MCRRGGGTSASAEIVDNYRHLWDGFPGLVRRIDRWTFGDDACVIELTLSGRHDGVYRGIEASGREIEFRIIAHFAFDADGRIEQETAYYDALTFMRQIGRTRRSDRTATLGVLGDGGAQQAAPLR